MSGSRWVTTLSWLSGSLRPFHTIFLCILATSSLSLLRLLGPYCFCPLLCPACMKCSLGISDFLEDISSLSQAIVFLFLCIVYVGRLFFFLITPCYSLKLWIQKDISFLFSHCSLLLFSQLFVRPPQTTILLFCISFFWGVGCYFLLKSIFLTQGSNPCLVHLLHW